MVRYTGWYSNRRRGDRYKAEKAAGEDTAENIGATSEIIVISGFKTKKVPPLMWRECIKKIYEVDPLHCPHCGGVMRIISFIYERKVIKKILDHLGLLKKGEAKRKRAPPLPVLQCRGRRVEPYDDGWPEYEEPFVDVQML
jgi:hypothetical protein